MQAQPRRSCQAEVRAARSPRKQQAIGSEEELWRFLDQYGERNRHFGALSCRARTPPRNSAPGIIIGCDFGSTTAKAVVLDHDGEMLFSCYALSQGNPIED